MIPRALYRLADALELTLEWHGELDGEQVRGKRSRRLELAGVPVQVPLEVIASRLFDTDAALVLQSTGELGLLLGFSAKGGDALSSRLSLDLLHLGRLGEPPAVLLDREGPASLAATEALLATAVVASFRFEAGDWHARAR